jgi:hypothetical protein
MLLQQGSLFQVALGPLGRQHVLLTHLACFLLWSTVFSQE